ncbi:translation initiation factor IF-2-like [Vidua chalybeata]|uniref:translation initiation factor IF-2-like n=1 Tax=Vidua chalybeata TaxID=81927 RepID=UPI0023A89D4A|nr:translation initiation factor IF-2-like [Vidua chalybeata]
MRGRLCSLSVHTPGCLDAYFPQYRRAPPAPLPSRTLHLAPLRSPGLPRSPAADAGAQKNARGGSVRGAGAPGRRHGGQLPSFGTGTDRRPPLGRPRCRLSTELPTAGRSPDWLCKPAAPTKLPAAAPAARCFTSPGLSPGRRRAGSPRTWPIWLGSPSGTAPAREEAPPPAVHDGD